MLIPGFFTAMGWLFLAHPRIGIVCPYSFDVPGGVQNHVRDLAEALLKLGHEVSVLAPADDD
ncbi:MAG TPA: glycosyltransferase, partial [Phycisphaerales bacterium]|nr:glycosyltransferase [Phycisphaerales bacterium]